MPPSMAKRSNFDIDRYINRYVPPSALHRLPYPISRFLGYRKQPKQDVGNILAAFWSLVGTFCGLAVVAAIFNNSPLIQADHPPALIASFGASAILEYNAIKAPLGQPRNAVLGHTFSAIIGVSITKLFRLRSDFERIKWIAGTISCSVASAFMLLTNTVHPPGGASAVLAATLPAITDMGWSFVGLVALGTVLMLLVGLVTNNIQRQFPVYWWTPENLRDKNEVDKERIPDGKGGTEPWTDNEHDEKRSDIVISASGVFLPYDLALNREEAGLIEGLRDRLRTSDEERRRYASSERTDCTMVPSH